VTFLKPSDYYRNQGRMSDDEIQQEFAILERAKKNPNAFSALYNKYFDRIFNFIYRQIDDEDVTADLCSQAFLSVLKNLNRYEFRGVPFSAWLYKIANNEVNKYYRKKKNDKVFSLEEVRVRELIDISNDNVDEEMIQRMLEYLRDLPTEMLEVLELRFFEDKNFKEIAFILDITESGAKMRTYRALDRLRSKFNLTITYANGKK
jgi:RNA polymerase sigma-70 factor, ECF subfamily